MNKLKITLSTTTKKTINTISSTSNVPGRLLNSCEISIDNAINVKIPQYMALHFGLSSQTARITNSPDRNHNPSGTL